MRVDDFDYPLPVELIADRPPNNRSDSRLMVVRRDTHCIDHCFFRDLPVLLSSGDLLVFNDTRVIPARLMGRKRGGGATIEILLLEGREPLVWEAIAQRAIRLSEGTVVELSGNNRCQVLEVLGGGRFLFRFDLSEPWDVFLDRCGEIPLPPYIRKKREELPERERKGLEQHDRHRYQTVYAESPGSAAAPTAGLHFDSEVMTALSEAGIERATVTLHVGLDTFSPVTVEAVEDHNMKSEWCHCPPETIQRMEETRTRGKRVIAVGTTTTRTLETCARMGWLSEPVRSRLFLKPGDEFLAIDALLTNFHLPRSTLLMLISALMGNDLRRKAYEAAVSERYRFYSYGDAMLIL